MPVPTRIHAGAIAASVTIAAIAVIVPAVAGTAAAQGPVASTKRSQMQADAVAARATWPRFVRLLAAHDGDQFLVKTLFTEGTGADKREELLWIRVTAVREGKLTGTVANRPAVVRTTRNRDPVTLPVAEVMDWLVTKQRRSYAGGYSLHDPEPFRSMRHEADRAGLPFFVLDGFLAGLPLSGPAAAADLDEFKKKTWARIWVGLRRGGVKEAALAERRAQYERDFDTVCLPVAKLTLLLSREGDPASRTITVASDAPTGFGRGELLFKIQRGARSFYGSEKNVRFVELMFVRVGEDHVPGYALRTNRN